LKKIDKTKAELFKELEETKKVVQELNLCQAEFEKSRERYEKLLDSSPDAMIFINTLNEIVLVNAQFEKIFGYSQEEILGKKLDILLQDKFRKKHSKMVQKFFENPDVRSMGSHFGIYAKKKDGNEFPADISLSPLQTDEELLIMADVRDISKRREAEEQIELNYYIQKVTNSMLKISLEPLSLEDQFDRILDLILNVPHLSLQSKGAIFLKYPEAEILTLKAQHGFTGADPLPCTEIPLGHCLCGKAASMSKLIYAEDMKGIHEIHDVEMFPHGHYCVPIVSGKNLHGLLNVYIQEGHKRSGREEDFLTSVASALATIIERDRTEQEKKDLQRQLTQAEKLAALGRFTANVAHEIRNPLTSVGGFARRYEYLFKEKIIAIKKSLENLPRFLFDSDLIVEVLENIVLNAIDVMPTGGTLTVTTEKEEGPGKSNVFIRIRDTGDGISEEQMKMIFEPFYTTKAAEHGTGLGLSITKKIMESLDGRVEVESEVGKGAEVILTLPFVLK
jgi:PAS domain S-box-containing protein